MSNIIISEDLVKQMIDQALANMIDQALEKLTKDRNWAQSLERQINQAVVQKTTSTLSRSDINTVIHQRVDEAIGRMHQEVQQKLSAQGIQDSAKQIELTVMDGHVVVENQLTAKNVTVVDTVQVRNLAVTGSVNTDNHSWQNLAAEVARRTQEQLTQQWRDQMVADVAQHIAEQGIDFDQVKVDGEYLVQDNRLSSGVHDSSLQSVGTLKTLSVAGDTKLNNGTVSVVSKRVGINTDSPEMALSVWDEEVALLAGKFKANTAYIGTARGQTLALGVNRDSAVEIGVDGITFVKKLRVGSHRIGHATEVPGFAGVRGDIMFNANPDVDSDVIGWVCLGGHNWKNIRTA